MSVRRIFNILLIFLAFLIVIAIYASIYKDEKEEQRKKQEEDDKLLRELEHLKTKKEIIEKHAFRNKWIHDYLEEKANKWYKYLIRGLLLVFVLTNLLVYFLVPDTKMSELFTWNEIIVGGCALIQLFIYVGVRKEKKSILSEIMKSIEFRVFKNRDRDYFLNKLETNNKEMEEVNSKIETLESQITNSKK